MHDRLKGKSRHGLYSQSDEGMFVEKLLKDMRMEVKLFVDYLYTEGLARYGGRISEYPFDINFLKTQYDTFAKRVESDLVAKYMELMENVKNYSKRIVEGESEIDPNKKYIKTYEMLNRIHENEKELKPILDHFYYELGAHMVYVTFFGNKDFTIGRAIKLSSFKFIKMYEEACSHFDLKPIVSFTSGNGVFDYKRALQELLKVSIYIKKF